MCIYINCYLGRESEIILTISIQKSDSGTISLGEFIKVFPFCRQLSLQCNHISFTTEIISLIMQIFNLICIFVEKSGVSQDEKCQIVPQV